MSTVGEQLRQAREARHLTIQDVAEATKIRTDHIAALEEGNYDIFSAPVYVRGFIRTYSTFLKLDTLELVAEANAVLATSDKHRDHHSFSPAVNRSALNLVMYQVSKVNWRIALPLILVVAVVVGAFFGLQSWKMHRDKDPLADLSPGLYQPNTKNSGPTLPLPNSRR